MSKQIASIRHGGVVLLALAASCASPGTEPTSRAVTVANPRAVGVGDGYTCALAGSGTIYCWGSNALGQLGNGTQVSSSRPTPVVGNHVFTGLSVGMQTTCGVTQGQDVFCWGAGDAGQLGDGSRVRVAETPVQVIAKVKFRQVTVGGTFACGIATDGLAWCWGDNSTPAMGALGTGDTVTSALPRLVFGGIQFKSVSAGRAHICGLDLAGRAYCWGSNGAFQLGNYPFALYVPGPGVVATSERFVAISAGTLATCAVSTASVLWCWGTDEMGTLGLGIHVEGGTTRIAPILAAQGKSFADVSLSNGSSRFGSACGLTSAGEASCWGANSEGQLGVSTQLPLCPTGVSTTVRSPCADTPQPVAGSARFRIITAGNLHSCGITSDDRVLCWGRNESGELGDGTRVSRSTPVLVN